MALMPLITSANIACGGHAGNENTMQDQTAQPDWYRYTLDLAMVRAAGEKAVYCSCNPNLIGGVLGRVTGRWLPELFEDLIAQPLHPIRPSVSVRVRPATGVAKAMSSWRSFTARLHGLYGPAASSAITTDWKELNGPFGNCTLAGLVEEFAAVRKATVLMFRALDEAAWTRRGVASNNEVTVLALAYMIAGHELHHRRIFQQNYFPASVS